MKKFIFALATMVLGIAPAMAQDIETIPDNSLYTLDATVAKGTTGTISVQMKNSKENVQAIGLYFTLPEGFSVPVEDGLYLIDCSGRTNLKKNNLQSNLVKGEYRVGLLSNTINPISGTSGEVFTITVNVADNVKAGDYEIRLFNVELSGILGTTTVKDEKGDDVEKNIIGIISNNGEYKGKITVSDPTSVKGAFVDEDSQVEIFDVNGVKQPSMKSGLNIVKNAKTGEVKKITIK